MTAKRKPYTKKKKLGNYPFITVVFSITISLIMVGILGLVYIHFDKQITKVKEETELHAYLNKFVKETEVAQVEAIINSQPYVNKKKGLKYISMEEANERFMSLDGGNDIEILDGGNYYAVKPSIIIPIKAEYSTYQELKTIKSKLENMREIFEVPLLTNKEEGIKQMNKVINYITIILICFITFSCFIIFILINNTIKLALFSQRFLIRSMQLVGAKAGFIRWPFLKRSLLHGVVSGIIAMTIAYFTLEFFYGYFDQNYNINLKHIENNQAILIVLGSLPALGALISTLSSYRAVNKYLALSLDELY